jgi:viroplasmin and RNaseH domain-containing protein
MDVWVYQGKELKVFASAEAAQKWFDENDPEGVPFMCEVEEVEPMPSIASGR